MVTCHRMIGFNSPRDLAHKTPELHRPPTHQHPPCQNGLFAFFLRVSCMLLFHLFFRFLSSFFLVVSSLLRQTPKPVPSSSRGRPSCDFLFLTFFIRSITFLRNKFANSRRLSPFLTKMAMATSPPRNSVLSCALLDKTPLKLSSAR